MMPALKNSRGSRKLLQRKYRRNKSLKCGINLISSKNKKIKLSVVMINLVRMAKGGGLPSEKSKRRKERMPN